MERVYAIVFFLFLGCGIQAITENEIDILCSQPDSTIIHIMSCTVKNDKRAEKFVDILHECVSKYFETPGRLESFKNFLCHPEIKQSVFVYACLYDRRDELEDTVVFDVNDSSEEIGENAEI
ncbi:uncharacterized protein LOC111637730 [Centruroides sculpturatus]|uniref:uncharacterized protein LOC111637730 n=1 Tax=Centruroides sculpturatus TaxID=218467 RepID=UPI000C6E80ED|nr:uncharacterized protein LOC111637730 [Centruroides sculpturatus]